MLFKFWGKFLKNWAGDEDATTAIEFSLLIIPYLMLSLGIIELALMFTSASLLEAATGNAARMIRTGQLQQSGSADPAADFRDALCSNLVALISCDNVVIEVQRMDSYTDYSSMQPTFDENGNMVSSGFDVGGSNDKLLIRTSYRYEMITPLVGQLLNGPDGSTLFISTIVLQTEPYEFQGAT